MKKLICVFIIICISGCNLGEEKEAIGANLDGSKMWVFVQFNIPEHEDIGTYYYFGRITEKLYGKIRSNKLKSGFVLLEDVKYWGTDDLIEEYRDNQNSGEVVFRIEDIRKIRPINGEPETGMGYEQYEVENESDVEELELENETASTEEQSLE